MKLRKRDVPKAACKQTVHAKRDVRNDYQTKAVPTLYLGTLGIMDEGTPGMIPSVNVKTSQSALQLVKGVKKDESTFVAHHLLNPLFLGF